MKKNYEIKRTIGLSQTITTKHSLIIFIILLLLINSYNFFFLLLQIEGFFKICMTVFKVIL